MTINKRLDRVISDLYGGNKSAFAAAIGVTPSVVDNIVGKRQGKPSFDVIEKISANAEINVEWLITGKGQMQNDTAYNQANIASPKPNDGIPLIPVKAMAGFFTGEVIIHESDCERINIPGIKADFAIPVSGDSMTPLYQSGDMVICQFVNLSDMFFQWGKVYVINTNQGVLLKRVRPGAKKNTIKVISENATYDPIDLPLSDIYQIALVKGLVRLT